MRSEYHIKKLLQVSAAVILFLLCQVSCTKSCPEYPSENSGTESLSFEFGAPLSATRALGDLADDPSKYTLWENLVDGRSFYHLTAFLIHDKKIVRCADWSASSGTSVRQEFVFDNLQIGAYVIVAVANWSGFSAEGHDYAGLDPTLQQHISSLITKAPKKAQDPPLTLSGDPDWAAVRDARLTLPEGSGGICPQEPMPLTAVRGDIYLSPGVEKTYPVELIRTRARLRLILRNESPYQFINLLSLTFGNFAGNSTSLFLMDPDVWNPGNQLLPIDVTASNAMTPFAPVSLPGIYESETNPVLTNRNKAVLFDGYIMEGQYAGSDPQNIYKYTIGITHSQNPVNPDDSQYTCKLENPVKTVENLKDDLYLIYNIGTKKFLSANGKSVNPADFPGGVIYDKNLIWQKNGNTLSTMLDQKYINDSGVLAPQSMTLTFDNSHVKSDSGITIYTAETLERWDGIKKFYRDRYKYLSFKKGEQKLSFTEMSTSEYRIWNPAPPRPANDSPNQLFVFYKVTPPSVIPPSDRILPLKYVNPDNGNMVDQITEIRRNDYVKVQLTVRYNETTGQFEYEVSDWDEKNGNISFH